MGKRSWSDEHFLVLLKESTSMRELLQKLGLRPAGGNYVSIKEYIKKKGFNSSHFSGKGWLKGKTHNWAKVTPLADLLKDDIYTSTSNLKSRLFKEGILKNECSECGLSKWKGKPISLHLDHIDGNKLNNQIGNLRILCPNCHSQTPTYCGRNRISLENRIKIKQAETPSYIVTEKFPSTCKVCNDKFYPKNKGQDYCSYTCYRPTQERISWPSDQDLSKMVWETPVSILSKSLGVSDKAVSKRCKLRKIEIPNRGYWQKVRKTGVV